MSIDIRFASIKQLKELLNKNAITSKEIITQTQKLFTDHKDLNCALEVFDNPVQKTQSGILGNIPGLIKDVICQKGHEVTCCSHILEKCIAPYNATVINRLHDDGAICIGRANCDQFGMGSSNEYSYFGPVKNPWNKKCVAGGSSGGSAAAVAAGLVPFALGAETGGSVRQPAALCGITGLKPTYGLLSRYGVTAYASSVDQVGIFTRDAYDNGIVLSSLAGYDAHDGTSTPSFDRYDYVKEIENYSPKGKKIGVISNAINAQGISAEAKTLFLQTLKEFEKMGAIVEYIDMPMMDYAAAVYFVISRAEAASNLARYDGVRYGLRTSTKNNLIDMYCDSRHDGFGACVKRRIMVGNYVLSAGYAHKYYDKARKVQVKMKEEFFGALKKYDMLFAPSSPAPAFEIGGIKNSLEIDLQDYFTCPANLTGIPAVSFPCGFINNMPMGFQLFGDRFTEGALLGMGHAYQQQTSWHLQKPSL